MNTGAPVVPITRTCTRPLSRSAQPFTGQSCAVDNSNHGNNQNSYNKNQNDDNSDGHCPDQQSTGQSCANAPLPDMAASRCAHKPADVQEHYIRKFKSALTRKFRETERPFFLNVTQEDVHNMPIGRVPILMKWRTSFRKTWKLKTVMLSVFCKYVLYCGGRVVWNWEAQQQ